MEPAYSRCFWCVSNYPPRAGSAQIPRQALPKRTAPPRRRRQHVDTPTPPPPSPPCCALGVCPPQSPRPPAPAGARARTSPGWSRADPTFYHTARVSSLPVLQPATVGCPAQRQRARGPRPRRPLPPNTHALRPPRRPRRRPRPPPGPQWPGAGAPAAASTALNLPARPLPRPRPGLQRRAARPPSHPPRPQRRPAGHAELPHFEQPHNAPPTSHTPSPPFPPPNLLPALPAGQEPPIHKHPKTPPPAVSAPPVTPILCHLARAAGPRPTPSSDQQRLHAPKTPNRKSPKTARAPAAPDPPAAAAPGARSPRRAHCRIGPPPRRGEPPTHWPLTKAPPPRPPPRTAGPSAARGNKPRNTSPPPLRPARRHGLIPSHVHKAARPPARRRPVATAHRPGAPTSRPPISACQPFTLHSSPFSHAPPIAGRWPRCSCLPPLLLIAPLHMLAWCMLMRPHALRPRRRPQCALPAPSRLPPPPRPARAAPARPRRCLRR
jgi:hypothetical protein